MNESKNSGTATSPVCLLFLPESNVASRPWIHRGHVSSRSGQTGCRGQCDPRSSEGDKDLPATKGCCENAGTQEQGSRPSSHTGSNPGHPLAEILGAKGECGHLQKARSRSQSLSVNQKKAYPPGGRVTHILPGQTSSEGGAYVGNPGGTWHPFFPGRGYSESSPDGRSAPAGPTCLDTLAHPPGPKLHC